MEGDEKDQTGREYPWKKDDEAIGGKEIGTIIYATRLRNSRETRALPPFLLLLPPLPLFFPLKRLVDIVPCIAGTRCWLNAAETTVCMDKEHRLFRCPPHIHLPHSPFILQIFRLHARVCTTGRRLMSAHPRKTSSSSSLPFFASEPRAINGYW